MGKLLLIRHVESQYGANGDREDRSEGWLDIAPSPAGRKEAQEVAASLANTPIEEVVSSDLQRTKILGRAIANATGATFSTTPRLRSINVGSLAGRLRTENKEILRDRREHPDKPFPGAQGAERTFRDYVRRWLTQELTELEAKAAKIDGYLAAITHSHNIQDAYEYLNGHKLAEQPETGSIWEIDHGKMGPWQPGDDEEDEDNIKESAGEAGYMELKGAVKDGSCEIVDVPHGISRERGCCNRWIPETPEATAFKCGTCLYEGS